MGGGTLTFSPTATVSGSNLVQFVNSGGRMQVNGSLGNANIAAGGGDVHIGASGVLNSLTTANAGTRIIFESASVTPLVLKIRSFGVGGGTTIDLGDNALLIDHAPGDTGSSFGQLTFFAGQATKNNQIGTGFISSTAALNPLRYAVGVVEADSIGSPTTFLGTSIDNSTTLARYTFKGDADLNGTVDFNDLLRLAKSYGTSGTWVNGDSDYSGTVDFNDLLAIARNYGVGSVNAATLASVGGDSFMTDFGFARSLVPEPAALGLLLGIGSIGLRRRREC